MELVEQGGRAREWNLELELGAGARRLELGAGVRS